MKENNKPIFELLTIKQYEVVIEIVTTLVRYYTGVPLTTYVAIRRLAKNQ